jgi:hypothetical protein
VLDKSALPVLIFPLSVMAIFLYPLAEWLLIDPQNPTPILAEGMVLGEGKIYSAPGLPFWGMAGTTAQRDRARSGGNRRPRPRDRAPEKT